MKTVAVYSKYITYTHYGFPVDHFTVSVQVSDELTPDEIEFAKENARHRLEEMPVDTFPVAGDYATLMPEYLKRHPELAQFIIQ
jgi:hypothetical protein